MNSKLDGLYDMVGFKPEQEDKFEEARFKKHMQDTAGNVKRNKKMFDENKNCFTKCPRYNPCAICDKCQNKASHLYIRCQTCEIPICTHKYNDRVFMIKRKNFAITVSRETMAELNRLSDKFVGRDK